MYVVPVFEETYADAKVPLPLITRMLIQFSGVVQTFGPWIIGGAILVAAAIQAAAQDATTSPSSWIGCSCACRSSASWIRDMAVLQLMEVLHNLMAAGYTLAEAVRETAQSVSNRAVRQGRARPASRHRPRRAIQPRTGTARRYVSADREPIGDRRRKHGATHPGHQRHLRVPAARNRTQDEPDGRRAWNRFSRSGWPARSPSCCWRSTCPCSTWSTRSAANRSKLMMSKRNIRRLASRSSS